MNLPTAALDPKLFANSDTLVWAINPMGSSIMITMLFKIFFFMVYF
jgi:hypothetical protein